LWSGEVCRTVCGISFVDAMAKSDFDRIARILTLVGVETPSNDQNLQPHCFLKEVLKVSSPSLLGSSTSEVSQWLTLSKTLTDSPAETPRILDFLDKYLKTNSFLIGFSFTVADVAVMEPLLSQSLVSFPEVNRWATLVRSRCHCHTVPQSPVMPTIFPVLKQQTIAATPAPAPASAPAATTKKEGKNKETKDSSVSNEKKEDSVSNEKKEAPEEQKKDQKKSKEKSKAEPAAKAESAPPASGAPDADLDPSKLEFRVGLVLKCWEHPEAEKLLCEEIDLGESTGPRQIASGLRAHYSAAQVQGRKVIVLANLKDRNMVGFKSQVCPPSLALRSVPELFLREW
jgi:aminoacyl tRNA synthase complex-interacting multifunctional protein 1